MGQGFPVMLLLHGCWRCSGHVVPVVSFAINLLFSFADGSSWLQVCLATLLAQVGAWVPAAALTLSPADAIFVRMGARDHIMAGQSTFYVELAETAALLAAATPCAFQSLAFALLFCPQSPAARSLHGAIALTRR